MRWLIEVSKVDLLTWTPTSKLLQYPMFDDLASCVDQLVQLARTASASSLTVSMQSVREVFSECGFQSRLVRTLLARCGTECLPQLSARDGRGLTPLHLAVQGGNTAVVQALLEAGAPCAARDHQGLTPLDWAGVMGYVAVVDLLAKRCPSLPTCALPLCGSKVTSGLRPTVLERHEALGGWPESKGLVDELDSVRCDIERVGLHEISEQEFLRRMGRPYIVVGGVQQEHSVWKLWQRQGLTRAALKAKVTNREHRSK